MSSATLPAPGPALPAPAADSCSQISRQKAVSLIRYLALRGGTDIHVFLDSDGQQDLVGARAYALRMRKQFGFYLDAVFTVEQRCHRVVLTTIMPSFA